MNVCMTRALRKPLMIGGSPTLCRNSFFEELIGYVVGVGIALRLRRVNRAEAVMVIGVERVR